MVGRGCLWWGSVGWTQLPKVPLPHKHKSTTPPSVMSIKIDITDNWTPAASVRGSCRGHPATVLSPLPLPRLTFNHSAQDDAFGLVDGSLGVAGVSTSSKHGVDLTPDPLRRCSGQAFDSVLPRLSTSLRMTCSKTRTWAGRTLGWHGVDLTADPLRRCSGQAFDSVLTRLSTSLRMTCSQG